MASHRFQYGLVLFFTGLFYIFFRGYLSHYVFWLAVSLPLFSLLCSLPAMVGTKVELSFSAPKAEKGQPLTLCIEVKTPFFLPGGRVRLFLLAQNTLTGEKKQEVLFLTACPGGQAVEHSLVSQQCGQLLCRLEEVRVYDYLGLFSFRKRQKNKSMVQAFCFPKSVPLSLSFLPSPPPLDSLEERYSPVKSGNDPSEVFGLREYRQGDRLSRIHWKLSEKEEKLLVKEMSLPLSSRFLFLLDLSGSGTQTDCLLEAFASLANFLTAQEISFWVWYQGTGSPDLREITESGLLSRLWQDILSAGPRPSRQALLSCQTLLPTGISHAILLCPTFRPEDLAQLSALLPDVLLTLLIPKPKKDLESALQHSVQGEILPLLPEALRGSLEKLIL